MDEAHERFESGRELYRCQVEVPSDFGMISEAQVRDWEQANARMSTESNSSAPDGDGHTVAAFAPAISGR